MRGIGRGGGYEVYHARYEGVPASTGMGAAEESHYWDRALSDAEIKAKYDQWEQTGSFQPCDCQRCSPVAPASP